MKKIIRNFLAVLMSFMLALPALAQAPVEMADGMRAEGKIYVVVAIILMVLIGLFTYLFLLDRKVKKLEDKLGNNR